MTPQQLLVAFTDTHLPHWTPLGTTTAAVDRSWRGHRCHDARPGELRFHPPCSPMSLHQRTRGIPAPDRPGRTPLGRSTDSAPIHPRNQAACRTPNRPSETMDRASVTLTVPRWSKRRRTLVGIDMFVTATAIAGGVLLATGREDERFPREILARTGPPSTTSPFPGGCSALASAGAPPFPPSRPRRAHTGPVHRSPLERS